MATQAPEQTRAVESAIPKARWFQQMPASVLIPQLFLAGGWLRAALSHSLSAGWWSGQDLVEFIELNAEDSVLGYRLFIDGVVEPFAAAIALFVLVAQVVIGVSLLLNWRPVASLAIGALLNLHFILAGAVNPSVFYLVLAIGIASWHLDQSLSAEARIKLARGSVWVALILAALLMPSITVVTPDQLVEVPAPVLIFVLLLGVIAARSMAPRQMPAEARQGLEPPLEEPEVDASPLEPTDLQETENEPPEDEETEDKETEDETTQDETAEDQAADPEDEAATDETTKDQAADAEDEAAEDETSEDQASDADPEDEAVDETAEDQTSDADSEDPEDEAVDEAAEDETSEDQASDADPEDPEDEAADDEAATDEPQASKKQKTKSQTLTPPKTKPQKTRPQTLTPPKMKPQKIRPQTLTPPKTKPQKTRPQTPKIQRMKK